MRADEIGEFLRMIKHALIRRVPHLRVDQRAQIALGIPNADFLKSIGGGTSIQPGYQRPFYARFGVRFEF